VTVKFNIFITLTTYVTICHNGFQRVL